MKTSGVARVEEQNTEEREWGRLNRYRASVVRKHCSGNRVLDAGCASDAYQDLVVSQGGEVVGLDIRPLASAHPFVQSSVLSLPFTAKSFDVALLFEVLEHVPNPEVALAELGRVADTLILTVPNCELGREFAMAGLAPFHYTDPSHVNFFTRKTLRELLAANGWEVESVDLFGGMSPAVLALAWIGIPVVKSRLLVAALRMIPGRPGTSIMIVARSPKA